MQIPTGGSGAEARSDHPLVSSELLTNQSLAKIFRLMDSLLPFEACLYYQLVPIDLSGSHLQLAMVNPEDQTAWSYVRRTLAFLNCTLVPRALSTEDHRTLLTRYLNRAKIPLPGPADSPSPLSQPSALDPDPENLPPTFVLQDQGQDLTQREPVPQSSEPPLFPAAVNPPPLSELLTQDEDIPLLELRVQHAAEPLESLTHLSPRDFAQELLGRLLSQGIGRLYFERQERGGGRVLWSQDGVLQSVLEGVPETTLQALINELKLLMHQPLLTVKKLHQVEIERRYGPEYLLLRLRLMPRLGGEEATLQVLRGAALRFYQQQQILTLSRDALATAHQLQRKVCEMHSRLQRCPGFSPTQIDALPILSKLLQLIEHQLSQLDSPPSASHSPTDA